ncbi:hypothetical protein BDF20DRAFT_836376 [Mycotypha africana]|uniref:uncharacterized protein n=1 Tax=Mycotypha africana TaxID=64632 RepID=UPI002301E40D|nr:uncharacterized protein BDF20DRAFT_836376 [Mycotypha africana]KAI8977592.1 hypothetical protein BDF20DRAFT_836376 [Mycotypha africana]
MSLTGLHFVYCKLFLHAEDSVREAGNCPDYHCLFCDLGLSFITTVLQNSSRKIITMDGNFQLERRNVDNGIPAAQAVGILGKSASEAEAWGSKEEVEQFEVANRHTKNEVTCVAVEVSNQRFKAASSSTRKLDNRYDENGVFSLSCARCYDAS